MSDPRTKTGPLQVAAVSYLNAQPLIGDLREEPRLSLKDCPPAQAAADLLSGRVDLALVPAVALAHDPELTTIPGLGIAARGPVDSVFLYLKEELVAAGPEGRASWRVALDPRSRSSQMLVRVYLEVFRGLEPGRIDYCEVNPDAALAQGSGQDAVLVIGDAALGREAPAGFRRLDLAELWQRETGLPFVFAVWALKRPLLDRNVWLSQRFRDALVVGEGSLEAIIDAFPDPLRVSRSEALEYLRHRIVYRLGPREEEGLQLFLEHARPRIDREDRCST